jgi:hypothetical protein
MKKRIAKGILFLVPLVLLLALLPVNERLKFVGLKDDCMNKGVWMYDRIVTNDKPIDIAFVGSSKTINGIDDRLLSESLADQEVVNLGYCRFGRNLQLVVVRNLVENKAVKLLILEVRETEKTSGHPIFPYVASSTDVLLPYPFFNKHIAEDVWNHFSYKLELTQDAMFSPTKEIPTTKELYGYVAARDTASASELNSGSKHLKQPAFQQKLQDNFALKHVEKISALCKENGVTLKLLFLPSFHKANQENLNASNYSSYGSLLFPPDSIFANPNHWFDRNHLNEAGAIKLSTWLGQKIHLD